MFIASMLRPANALHWSGMFENGLRKANLPTRIRSQILHGTPPECDPVIGF